MHNIMLLRTHEQVVTYVATHMEHLVSYIFNAELHVIQLLSEYLSIKLMSYLLTFT